MQKHSRECQFMRIILLFFASESVKIDFLKKCENPEVFRDFAETPNSSLELKIKIGVIFDYGYDFAFFLTFLYICYYFFAVFSSLHRLKRFLLNVHCKSIGLSLQKIDHT